MARNLGDRNLNGREKVFQFKLAAAAAKCDAKIAAKDVLIKKRDLRIKTLEAELKKLKSQNAHL